jgi:hypothetical protein
MFVNSSSNRGGEDSSVLNLEWNIDEINGETSRLQVYG